MNKNSKAKSFLIPIRQISYLESQSHFFDDIALASQFLLIALSLSMDKFMIIPKNSFLTLGMMFLLIISIKPEKVFRKGLNKIAHVI